MSTRQALARLLAGTSDGGRAAMVGAVSWLALMALAIGWILEAAPGVWAGGLLVSLLLAQGLLWGWSWRRARRLQEAGTVALQEQSDLLEETCRVGRLGHWSWSPDTGRVVWSDELYRIYGRTREAAGLQLAQVDDWFHPDDREALREKIQHVTQVQQPIETEFRIVRADGDVRTISVRAEWVDKRPGHRLLRGIQQDITDLANIRETLRTAQEDYRFLFQGNPLPLMVYDRESLAILAMNEASIQHYGYSKDELLGMSVLDIRPEAETEQVRRMLQVPPDMYPQGRTWTHRKKDGTPIRVRVHGHELEFEGHHARLVVLDDVTEREMAEQRFQLVARATSDAVYDWDIATGSLWWSDSFYQLFGYSPGEMKATLAAWEERIHPEDLAATMQSLEAAVASDLEVWEGEYRFRRAQGDYVQVMDRGFFLRKDGTALRMVGGMLDISERARSQADLRLLRRAVEATDNGIVISDALHADLPVVYVNPAFEDITGYDQDEIIGRNCRLLQGDDRQQLAIAELREALESGGEARVLLRNYRKDGALFWNDLHIAPVRDEAGTLTHYVGVLRDTSERQRYEEQLAHRATHDELTGLPNRQLLQDRLEQAILNAERYHRQAGVIFVDLDDFKLVNDSLGHSAGDLALREIGARLQRVIRDTDTAGRFGGDEFVVVLTEQLEEDGMHRVIRRIVDAVTRPMDIAGVSHTLTPSIGYCRYPDDGRDAETLLMHADVAMYQAKRQGRNQAVRYRSEFDENVSQRLQLIGRLREALQNEEFVLDFQPIWSTDGRPVALEALVRWQHPEQGLLLPAHFIGVCEQSGLIVELGRRILREAARHHGKLVAAGLRDIRICVNVSAAQFAQDLHAEVEAVVRDFSLPAGVLELELTESVVMENPERAIDTMQRIARLGVGMSVDDFGTGHSSLTYLKRLPIDRLKIDRSFVQDLPDDEDDAAICASTIAMAHALGLQTVAEGVETVEQLAWLRARNCDLVQGYLLARPQPFDLLLPTLLAAVQPPSA